MTDSADKKREVLTRKVMIEDILAASDECILAETREDGQDPAAIAAAARALFEKAVTRGKTQRLDMGTNMTHIIITPEAHAVIRGAATRDFKDTSSKMPDGMIKVPVSEAVYDWLQTHRFVGETISDVIVRSFSGTN